MRERGAPELTACVILTRGEGERFEVCWERRALDAAFLPGYHAFVGGRVEPADDHIIGLILSGGNIDRPLYLRALADR